MQSPAFFPQSHISELFFCVWHTRSMTTANRHDIMSALLNDSLNESDYRLINRLLHAVRRGWVKIVEG